MTETFNVRNPARKDGRKQTFAMTDDVCVAASES